MCTKVQYNICPSSLFVRWYDVGVSAVHRVCSQFTYSDHFYTTLLILQDKSHYILESLWSCDLLHLWLTHPLFLHYSSCLSVMLSAFFFLCSHSCVFVLTHRSHDCRKHYYEYINNPEAISLNSGRHRYGPQGRRKSDKELLFGSNKKGTSRESDSDSPVRTPQEMMNAADAGQTDSLPDNEVVGIQMEWNKQALCSLKIG